MSRADTLDEIRQRGVMLWGGDQEGGGPYIFPREDNPSEVVGFEVDLAGSLGAYLKVKPVFTQGQWDKMPDMLRTGKVQVILNGYELTPERLEGMSATLPYYVYALQLLGRTNDPSLRTWEDLKTSAKGSMRKIGVLTGSAAETYSRTFCNADCEVVSYDGNTDSMREVETGKLDATVQDTPIASFYASRFPGLRRLGTPVAKGYYVAYAKREDASLTRSLNEALVTMIRTGELERLYRTYGIWDERQDELVILAEQARFFGIHGAASTASTLHEGGKAPEISPEQVVTASARKHGWAVVRTYGPVMAQSAGLTIVLAVSSFPLAMLLGLLVAVGRLYGPGWVRVPLTSYVEFLRGTPLLLQLYFVFFFLPEVGVSIPAFWTAILGLAVNYSAYESEIYRAGIQAVPPGQLEAALSLGMSRGMALRRIVVPQAVRMVIPPIVNDFIALFKDTSVCSVITLIELTKRFSVLSMSTQATVELMMMTAALYLAMSYPLSLAARVLERRLGHEVRS